MKYFVAFLLFSICIACNQQQTTEQQESQVELSQQDIKNEQLKDYSFLAIMYSDSYYPKAVVDKAKAILVVLCIEIETEEPKNLDALYRLTHKATRKFNTLQADFDANGSELETVAREAIAVDVLFIADTYGFDADIEELIAPREW